MKFRNIYIFGITDAYGGIESIMHSFVDHIQSEHLFKTINLVVAHETFCFENEYRAKGINIIKTCEKKYFWKYYDNISHILASIVEDDVVYVNLSSYCNWILLSKLKNIKGKVIIHGHNSSTSNIVKKILHRIGRSKYKKVGTKIAVSESCNKFMFDNKAEYIVYNGIESNKFKFNLEYRMRLRKELNIPDNRVVVGCVGRISKEKNQTYLMPLAKKYEKLSFVFVGGEPNKKYAKHIKSIATDNCLFLGQSNIVHKYLSIFDCVVIPSKHEAFPLVALESYANGLMVFFREKLFDSISPAIKKNPMSKSLKREYIDMELIKKQNYLRNIGCVNNANNLDLNNMLEKIVKILYEQ